MKMKLVNKSLMSWLLSFAMIIGLLSGVVLVKETSEAADDSNYRPVIMGDKDKKDGYYSYPDAKIDFKDKDESYQYLTILVDSGYLTVKNTKLGKVTGKGILYGTDMDAEARYKDLDTNGKYEAINFDLGEDTVLRDTIESYIQDVHFTTEATKTQKVTITVMTTSGLSQRASIAKSLDKGADDVYFDVHYFNGHFYAYIDSTLLGADYSWTDAYELTKKSDFHGVKGYLATLTSRAEDRFLYDKFFRGNTHRTGWLGATRAIKTTNGYTDYRSNLVDKPTFAWGTDAASLAKIEKAYQQYLEECRNKLAWSWVTGPEEGTVFGYQNATCGDGIKTTSENIDDGGFVTYDGLFSNWRNKGNIEPNGGLRAGTNQDEAYGYYGEDSAGRWNDYPITRTMGFYIEFGGFDGDGDALEKADGDHAIYTETEDSGEIISDEDEYGKIFYPGPYIENENADGTTDVGTKLTANISKIHFIDKDNNEITYQWYILNDDGELEPIEDVVVSSENWNIDIKSKPATDKNYYLTDFTFGKTLVVRVTETDPKTGKVVGTALSDPYETGKGKHAISGSVTIKDVSPTDENAPAADDDQQVVKANVSNVKPSGIQDDLHYEWYVADDLGNPTGDSIYESDDPYYVVDPDYEGEDLVVVVTPKKETGYEGEITSDPHHIGEKIDGQPEIVPNGANKVGTKLSADVSGIYPKGKPDVSLKDKEYTYQWYVKDEKTGKWNAIPGATKKDYTLTDNTVGKDIQVSATIVDPDYSGTVTSEPYTDRLKAEEKTPIDGKPVIEQTGDTLTAVVEGIGPDEEAQEDLDYQWFVKDENGNWKEADNGKDSTLDASGYPDGTEFYVEVTVPEENPKYTGSANSDKEPTGYTYKKTEVEPEKTPIYGLIEIENLTTDDAGERVNRVGTRLFANIDNVGPEGCHDSLTYQWYYYEKDADGNVKEVPIPQAQGRYYALTEDTIDKTIIVKATAVGDTYYGTVGSNPYNATRTNSDLTEKDDGNGRKSIFVTPAEDDMEYTVKQTNGNDPEDMKVFKHDKNGNKEEITGNPDYMDEDGYYTVDKGETLEFEVDSDGDYIVREREIGKGNTTVVTPTIPDSDITVTEDANGNLTITIDPADKDKKYAVLKKDGDGYVAVTVTKKDGKYVYDEKGNAVWSDSGETVVTFTDLPGNGTYKIVAIGTNLDDDFKDVTPGDIANNGTGGSKDLTASDAKKDSGTGNGQNFTDAEKKKADDMLNGSFTNPKDGSIIKDVDDCTRDKIIESEKEWNKLTDREKEAVNAKLKELGSKYTYEELLKMAKAWKIPYFQVTKALKKGKKTKLKMIKCSGATVLVSSTKPKVATISKKGVIKAKKAGKTTCTITVVKGNYTNRLVVKVTVKAKKFKQKKEGATVNTKKIKTPTLLLIHQRRVGKKPTPLKIKGLAKGAKVTYKSFNPKVVKINKKGKYTAKKKGKVLLRATVKQNGKKYLLYLSVNAYK